MTIYKYKTISYAILVKGGKWTLEDTEGSALPVVPAAYKEAVAEYLAVE